MKVHTLVLGAVLSLSSAARAEASDADVARWRAAGVTAYEAGDHRTALENFQKAYDTTRDSALLYAMAQSERALGHCERAVPLFERFIVDAENEPQKEAARANIERCRAELAAAPPAEVEPPPASTAQAIEENGQGPAPAPVTPAPTASAPANAAKSAEPARAATARPEAAPGNTQIDALAGTLMATGVALGAVGTVLLLQAGGEEDAARRVARDPERGDYQSNVDDFRAINQKRSTARVLTVGGGLLVGFGVLRYVMSTGDAARVTVSPGGALAEFTKAF